MNLPYAVRSAVHLLQACGRKVTVRSVNDQIAHANGGRGARWEAIRALLGQQAGNGPATDGQRFYEARATRRQQSGNAHARDKKVSLKRIVPPLPPDVDFGELEAEAAIYVGNYAAENKSGTVTEAKVRALRVELYGMVKRASSWEDFAAGLRAANRANAPNARYVLKAALSHAKETGDEDVGRSDDDDGMATDLDMPWLFEKGVGKP